MINYFFKRMGGMVLMIIGITFLTTLVISLAPGGPVDAMTSLNPKVSLEVKEKLVKLYDLDKPLLVRYGKWIKRVAQLDFGTSFKDNRPVIQIIRERLPKTLLLTISSLLLAFLLSIPIGIISALKQNTMIDRALTAFVFLGFSMPTFWVALLLMIFFGIHLGWFPITGFQSILADEMSFFERMWDIAKHLALPLLVTGLTGLASLSRYMRYEMLEVVRQDYIRTARAKGLTEKRIVLVHALRNTLIPFLTILGLALPGLISAGVIFETIFSYPGLGRLMFEAVMERNIPVIMASVTIGAFLTLLGNLISDMTYAYADPRIRYR